MCTTITLMIMNMLMIPVINHPSIKKVNKITFHIL